MKKRFLSCFGFICILFSKCIAFDGFLSFKESKLMSLQDISFGKSPAKFSAVDKNGKPYKKIALFSTYATGRDMLYQGGGALAYYLNPNIYIKTGPSWCRDIGIDKKWKWAMQLSYEIPFS